MERLQPEGGRGIWHRTFSSLPVPVPSLRSYAPTYLIAIACLLFWAVSILQFPLGSFLQSLNVDDSFYYYVIARNFTHGMWSTFDGANLTNGYHPAWAFLLTPVFALVSDPVAALRAGKLLEELCLFGSALCILAVGRAAGWNWIIASIVPLWLFAETLFFNGMESSPQILILACSLLLTAQLFARAKNRSIWIALALVCALMPWVRLELVSAAVTLAAGATAYFHWRREWHGSYVLILWGGVAVGFLGYLAYNQLVFGTPLPVSGQIKNYWSSLRIANDPNFSFIANATEFLRANWKTSFVALVLMGIVCGSWSIRAYRDRLLFANHAIDLLVISLAVAHFSRLFYSMLTMHAIYDFGWYYIPGKILVVLLVPVAASRLIFLLRTWFNFTPRWMELIISIPCLILAWAIQNPLETRFKLDPQSLSRDWEIASYEGVQWMNENLPSGSRIGSADAGALGYFSVHQVINLDGLVNSAVFFSAVQSQSVERWIHEAGITHLAGGMEADVTDGCAYMARASVQTVPYKGPCRKIHEGAPFKAWFGRELVMRFQVFEFGAKAGN